MVGQNRMMSSVTRRVHQKMTGVSQFLQVLTIEDSLVTIDTVETQQAWQVKIRSFHPEDADQIAQLFHETIREISVRDYSISQVKAWAPDDLHFRNWAEVCSNRFTFVADLDGTMIGFAELELNGHIDCFYCHKDYQRCGVGRQLYSAIAQKAFDLKLDRLYTEASITAKPFFQRMGFSVVREQQVTCRGETFTNYAMEKILDRKRFAKLQCDNFCVTPQIH
jgi:putative acetyltransferase